LAESLVNERQHGGSSGRTEDQQIDLILEQARRVMTITRQISEFSLQRPLEQAFVDLNSLVKSTCSFISFDKRFRRIAMHQELASDLPALLLVSDHIVQVLMNLLINAADALEGANVSGLSITVSTRLDGATVLLAVSDNGPGMAADHLVRVFEPHFTTKAPGKGSGLGLSLCRNLVEQDGGTISALSTLGEGTIVTVSLPVPSDLTK
jgi:two-component system NtrC family sensor kinase